MKCSLILTWAIWSHLAILTNEISSNHLLSLKLNNQKGASLFYLLDKLEIKCQIKAAIHCLKA